MKVKDIFEAFLPREGTIDERDADHEVRIVVHAPGSLGGTPSVALSERGIQVGFDWDHGKLLLTPEVPLTRLTPEDVAAIHESVKKGQSWHAYEAHKQMREKHKEESDKYREQIQELADALRLMMTTYTYQPPCHNWENQVDAHKRGMVALVNAGQELPPR